MRNHFSHITGVLGLLLLLGLWAHFSTRLMQDALMQAGWLLLPLSILAFIWLPWDVLAIGQLLPERRPWIKLGLLEWASDGLGRLIPSAGLAGEPFRYRHLHGLTPEPGRVVLVYRILHAITGLLATAVTALACSLWQLAPNLRWLDLAMACGSLTVIGTAALLAWRPFPRRHLMLGLAWKTLSRIGQTTEIAMLLVLLGLQPTPEKVLLLQAFLSASASIFAFVPGGLGVQEGALLQGCVALGLGPEVGFQLGFLRRCRQLSWSSLGLLAAMSLEAALKSGRAEQAPTAPEDAPGVRPSLESPQRAVAAAP